MKRNKVSLAVLIAALSFAAAPFASAITPSQVSAIKQAVSTVPAAEVAARAADLVTQARASDRQDVALTAVREVVSSRPATLVPVVAAICKAAPEVSVAVAAEAAKLVADQAPAIARAAASAAPSQADKIAAAIAKASPASATRITRAVATAVPDQTLKITETVVAAVPAAQNEISSDSTLRRLSQSAAAENGVTGIITTRPGTIRGTPIPNVPPLDAGDPTPGFDEARRYAR